LELANSLRDLAFFTAAIDRKSRGCDLMKLRVSDLVASRSFESGRHLSPPWRRA
jgi:hypothetical protein